MHIPAPAWIIPAAVALILIAAGLNARAAVSDMPERDQRSRIPCWIVVQAVTVHGVSGAERIARARGYTSHQIREARRCLGRDG